MINLAEAEIRIEKYCKDYYNIFQRYHEPHRYYHNINHILKMLDYWFDYEYDNYFENWYYFSKLDFLYAILFHDICSDPKRNDNVEASAKLFNAWNVPDSINREEVTKAILATKEPWKINNYKGLSWFLVNLDISELKDYQKSVNNEKLIFKEYQFVDYTIYKNKRLEILNKIPNVNKEYLTYFKNKEVNIGVYAGSFDPFHIGHKNILEKAEEIFDKVIVAKGYNPEKKHSKYELKEVDYLKYHQVDTYEGLLSDYLQSKEYNVTLIRGLRNSTDLQAEITLQRYLKDLKPDIKIVYIVCDNEFEHISSSSIKSLLKYGKGFNYIVK